jgi:hypothetical protein
MMISDGIRGKWRYDPKEQKLVATSAETRPFSAPAIHQDSMNPTWHPATGEVFESKSAFRRVTKERGYVEIDDDKTWSQVGEIKPEIPLGLREDIEEVKHWYSAAMRGNRDYINANVPPELRDCEEVDPNDITEGIRR